MFWLSMEVMTVESCSINTELLFNTEVFKNRTHGERERQGTNGNKGRQLSC